jgi:hypothetical protein
MSELLKLKPDLIFSCLENLDEIIDCSVAAQFLEKNNLFYTGAQSQSLFVSMDKAKAK